MNRSRPGWSGLRIVTVFLLFASLMALFIGILLLFPGELLESLWRFNPEARAAFQSMGKLSSVLLFAVGAIAGGAAVGIHRRQKCGWWLAVLLFAVNACGDVVSLFVAGRMARGVTGFLISGLFLLYLVQPRVLREFSD